MPVDDTHRRVAAALGITPEQVRDLEEAKGVRPESLLETSEERLRTMLLRVQFGNLPAARDAFRRLQEENESGYIPPEGLTNALFQLDSMRMRAAVQDEVAGVPCGTRVDPESLLESAGLTPGGAGWRSLGPGNIGGRTRSIVVHPQNRNILWAGSVGGGIWRTANAGTTWQPVDDFMANLAVTSIVIDPTNPDRLYAGTGEGFNNNDALRGGGIFETTDGITWRLLPATNREEMRFITRLAVSADGAVLLASTKTGIWRSEDAARAVWRQVLNDPIGDVDCHPTDSRRAIAGSLTSGESYFSSDGGNTWTRSTHAGTWRNRVEVAYAVADPSVVYASVNIDGGEIWRSPNHGIDFDKRRSEAAPGRRALYLGEQGWYANVIWAGDPRDRDFVIAGGVDLWRSTDGGDSLVPITDWQQPTSVHADHHCIAVASSVLPLQVYAGNDGGVYRADDLRTAGRNATRSDGWTTLVNTYEVTQFYAAAGNPATGVIIGGTQDNGTVRFDPTAGPQRWTKMFGGDGGWCASDPTDPRFFYGEYVNLNIHRSTDEGRSADFISGMFWNNTSQPKRWDFKPAPFTIEDSRNSRRALFIAPFVLDPNDPDTLIGGGAALWRTNDVKTPNTTVGGPTWEAIKPPVALVPLPLISAIAIARGSSDTIWIGYDKGRLERTSNGTAALPAWSAIAGPLPARYCTSIVISPADRNLVYVTFGGYERSNVWHTRDGGTTWTDLGISLPAVPVRALAIHPDRADFLYLGTEIGVFASENGGATWSPTNEGPTNCSVDDLFWMDRTLVCATHGRGVFTIDLSGV